MRIGVFRKPRRWGKGRIVEGGSEEGAVGEREEVG